MNDDVNHRCKVASTTADIPPSSAARPRASTASRASRGTRAPQAHAIRRLTRAGKRIAVLLRDHAAERQAQHRGVFDPERVERSLHCFDIGGHRRVGGGRRAAVARKVEGQHATDRRAALDQPRPEGMVVALIGAQGRAVPLVRAQCGAKPLTPLGTSSSKCQHLAKRGS